MTSWKCYAKPAALGRTCGHVNASGGKRAGVPWDVRVVCESCGCHKKASDDRRPKESTDV